MIPGVLYVRVRRALVAKIMIRQSRSKTERILNDRVYNILFNIVVCYYHTRVIRRAARPRRNIEINRIRARAHTHTHPHTTHTHTHTHTRTTERRRKK